MSRIVVSNAGPLMVFSKLNILHLLKQLYGQVVFPRAVYDECVISGIRQGFQDAFTLDLFLTQNRWQPDDCLQIPADVSSENLDRGEKEAISLAISYNATILMDEERGRRVARKKGLSVKGSLGILIQSYREKLISEDQLKLYFHQISKRKDIWISPELCNILLEKELKYL